MANISGMNTEMPPGARIYNNCQDAMIRAKELIEILQYLTMQLQL